MPCAQAQPTSSAPSASLDQRPDGWVPSFRSMGRNALTIAEAPFALSRSEQLLTLGASGVMLSVMSTLDRPVYRRLQEPSGPARATTAGLATPGQWYDRIGPDRAALGTAGLLAASGLVLGRRSWTRTSVRVLEAVAYTKVVTGVAKGLASRSRPFVGDGPFAGAPGTFDGAHPQTSMPSGHTARAFAIASVLAHQANRWYVSVPAYGLAASVGAERIRSGDHWLTDVAVGGALGYAIGRVVASSSSASQDVTYTPILSTDRVGLSVQF
ncbi:phosphatase PAP2 family protein [Salinibacter altiplanensis]|uniref:phosphatase PAP2 family protein n=1 Tax=Salinibacter altiplanensis TaxID=1803181 RepID=UPI0013000768|nr:phosphatase PAP2 family protein [Salinibacter altiplanensis]